MKTCKNCGHTISGKFCANCGQDTAIERVTKKYILHEILKLFANVKSGKFFLTKQLFTHPGSVAKGYIEGKRKKYYNPIQFYLGTTAITVFLMLKLDTQTIILGNLQETDRNNEMYKLYIDAIYRYFNIAEFLVLPLLCFFTYMFFKRTGYNYAEMFILNTYSSAQRQIVNIIFIFLMFLFPGYMSGISLLSIIFLSAFFIWFYLDFFTEQKKINVILKSAVIMMLFYLSIMTILTGIFVLFYYRE